jgi:hypothetical protein
VGALIGEFFLVLGLIQVVIFLGALAAHQISLAFFCGSGVCLGLALLLLTSEPTRPAAPSGRFGMMRRSQAKRQTARQDKDQKTQGDRKKV